MKENLTDRQTGKLTGFPSIDCPQCKNSSYFEKHPFIPNIDIITVLKMLTKKIRSNPAIDCNNLKATYQELIDDSHMLSLAFKKLGVKKGDIITVSLPSNYQAIITFFALNELGAVTTYIDTFSSYDEVRHYIEIYKSPIFINFDKSLTENNEILKDNALKYIVTLNSEKIDSKDFNQDRHEIDERIISFHALGNIAKDVLDIPHLPNGNRDAVILYTSGSTGQPKAVVLTNKNILAAQMYAGNTSHTENITATKTMTCVPLRYPYGMVTSLLTSLLWGKECIMTPDWDSDTVEYYCSKKPNIIFGSPAVLDIIMRFLPDKCDMSQLTHFISGGDFMTEKHAEIGYEFFRNHGCKNLEIGNGCGNAETVSIGSTPVGVLLKQSTAGKILVGSTPLIIDKDIDDTNPITNGNELEEKKYGEIGELCLAGSHVFKKYYQDDERTQLSKFKRNGKEYFRTGTIGFLDEEGYFTPVNRKSRFYIRSTGHKVYMDNVQRMISCINGVADCAVVKNEDEDELYVNWAFIVLQNQKENDNKEEKNRIFNALKKPIITTNGEESLKEYEIPRNIVFVSDLPRITGTEKIDYVSLENEIKDYVV